MARRYMDDILLIYARDGAWDHERLRADLERSECYMKPLKLEPAAEGVFLESEFEIKGGRIAYRLKNANAGAEYKVWRYQPIDSYVPESQKMRVLVATLKKVEVMASDDAQRVRSGLYKLREFASLGYPKAMRAAACFRVGADTNNVAWKMIAMMQAVAI